MNELRLKEEQDKGKTEYNYLANLYNRIGNIYSVNYNDTAYRNFEEGLLHHDDVIEISKMMYENYPLLTSIIAQKYPCILVDEYQDTAKDTIISLIDFLLERNKEKMIIGFFGDSHQKIYDSGVGDLEKYYLDEANKKIELVKKEENYRSSKEVVDLLNKFRTNIKQKHIKEIAGSVKFLYWADHPSTPKKNVTEFRNSLIPHKDRLYDAVICKLKEKNWQLEENGNDKILVLVNSRVAKRANFETLYKIFSTRYGQRTKEKLLDRDHSLITFFVGYIDKKTSQERQVGLEHLIQFWEQGNQNQVIRFIKKHGSILDGEFKHSKKKQISDLLNNIVSERNSKTVKDVFDIIIENGIMKSEYLNKFIDRVNSDTSSLNEEETIRIQKDKALYDNFMRLPYVQIIKFWEHIQNHTVFSTKHGTKGDEYRNVLTVIDDTEWMREYNFKNFFNNTEENEDRKLRTRNLFYVECSRTKENLVVISLSEMDELALSNIRNWFGTNNVIDINEFIKS